MFKLLRKKHIREIAPSLYDQQGTLIESEEGKLLYVHKFYADIFAKDPARSIDITNSRAHISRARSKVVNQSLQA